MGHAVTGLDLMFSSRLSDDLQSCGRPMSSVSTVGLVIIGTKSVFFANYYVPGLFIMPNPLHLGDHIFYIFYKTTNRWSFIICQNSV